MELDDDRCWKALHARDARYDGVFFVGVATTGIYCRPVCPARTPARDRCSFYSCAAEAEQAGFRACLRCRPELAPGTAPVDAVGRLVRRAVRRIDAGYLDAHSVDDLAAGLGVSARHLRRATQSALGVSPIDLATTRRLAVARQLLRDTALPVSDIAFAAGFGSVRRFNAAFASRHQTPRTLREGATAGIALRLDYRPPLAWDVLLAWLHARSLPGVEDVTDGVWRRVVVLGDAEGHVTVRPHGDRALRLEVSLGLARRLVEVVARVRNVFDLDARPAVIADHLGADPLLAASVAARPGLRVPGAFDGFEATVRVVLGQQISVRAAVTIARRLVERFGRPVDTGVPGLDRAFPTPETLAAASIDDVASLGMPGARAATVIALSRAVADGDLSLWDGDDPDATREALLALPGIGPWTADVVALRVLRWPDAFPAGDLGVRRALGAKTDKQALARAEPWRPWRAYGVVHLWTP